MPWVIQRGPTKRNDGPGLFKEGIQLERLDLGNTGRTIGLQIQSYTLQTGATNTHCQGLQIQRLDMGYADRI